MQERNNHLTIVFEAVVIGYQKGGGYCAFKNDLGISGTTNREKSKADDWK